MTSGRVQDKVIVVTGASSGIGKAAALRLGREGAKLGLLDLVSPQKVADEITAAGGTATAAECDVRSGEQVEASIQIICEKYGPLDGAANMAGIIGTESAGTERGLFLNILDDEWDRTVAVNITGIKNCLRSELHHMNPAGGSIINAGSVSGLVGSPYNAAYGASKAAVMSLSVSVAQEMGKKGIRVNAIAPGIVITPMAQQLPEHLQKTYFQRNALGRPGEPEEVANMLLFLLSNESSFCTGTVYNVDAGRR